MIEDIKCYAVAPNDSSGVCIFQYIYIYQNSTSIQMVVNYKS